LFEHEQILPAMPANSLPVIRELVRCYQAFEAVAGTHIRSMGLTPPQFDIIATLGNTQGMRFKELGEKTLCTKGTLTGIVDRLAEKGLVRRVASPTDGRSQIVQLTPAGEALFAKVFPAQLRHMDEVLAGLDTERMVRLQQELHHLRETLEQKAKA
jgi:MarR family transcriptional regulator, 2-MHQ and catechol-resistance regulon repressor